MVLKIQRNAHSDIIDFEVVRLFGPMIIFSKKGLGYYL